MSTIAALMSRIEKHVALASGLNVQIHAEEQLLEMLRYRYNTLFDDHWWPEFTSFTTFALDGTTGRITGDLSSLVTRFRDIGAMYRDQQNYPISLAPHNINPLRLTQVCMVPLSAAPTKLFQIYPVTTTGNLSFWYRTRVTDAAWDIALADITDINMDDDLLVLGVIAEYLASDGSNPDLAGQYEKRYMDRKQQFIDMDFTQPIAKRSQNQNYPTDWVMGPDNA